MPDDKSISELITAEQQSGSDLFEIAIPNALSDTGYLSRKVSATELANLLLKQLLFTSDLTTTAKTIIAAINEAAQSGGGGGASANEALPYDENSSYEYGDYCIQNNYLWRCTSTTGATGTWDATKWVAVMITDEYKRVRIMTKAQFDLLSNDEKDGFIYVSDYPTKIQDIDNVNLTTSDNNKLLGVSVSGSDISVGAVETTAADIPYTSGVSVADMLTPTAFTITPKANVTLGNVQAFKIGKMRIISLYFTASAGTSSILSVSEDSLPQDYIYCSLGMQQGVTHDGYGYLDTNGDFGTNANVIAGKLYTVNFIYVVA